MQSMNKRFFLVMLSLVIIACLSLRPSPALAQSKVVPRAEFEALKEEFERFKTEFDGFKNELKLLRETVFYGPPQPPRSGRVVSKVSISGNPMMGRQDAPVTLIEFSDYQCALCRKFFQDTLPELRREYIDTGKVRHIFRDYPLDVTHPEARKAAEAAHCAGEHGKYWEMHDLLFQNQQAIQAEKLKTYAHRIALDPAAFSDCLDKGTYGARVQKNYEDGVSAGVRGTPGFFLGKTRPGDTIQGVLIRGARSITVFRRAIEILLREPH